MIKVILSFLIFLSLSISLNAQNTWIKKKIQVPPPVCYASGKVEKSYIPPPKELFLKSGLGKKSNIIVDYSLFPADAKKAFEFAVEIWETIIESDIPIHIQANWRMQDKNTLGSAGPSEYYADFENAPRKNRFYPVALAEKLTRSEINPSSSPDIVATFNKEITWYFGTDSNTPDQMYNFVTVVLHEIGHGLGFTGFFYVSGSNGIYENNNLDDATSFDIMIQDNKNQYLVNPGIYGNPSNQLYNAFISNSLYINSPVAIINGGGNKPRLYAPTTWNEGSSIYHLNDATYSSTSGNSLMTHAIGKGETVYDPGPITRGIMADLGWDIVQLHLDKPKDIEEIKPIAFNLNIESNFELDTASIILYYSLDEFGNHMDSIPLNYNKINNNFSNTLETKFNTSEISYYIAATDNQKRTFFLPSEAPGEFYIVNIGPDNEAPVISHTPIQYFITNDKILNVRVQADDNLGIDTVYVEYALNGIPQIPFGLSLSEANTYAGIFNFDIENLKDGDEITYQIVAIDASLAGNQTNFPSDDVFSFKIEKIFAPIGGYYSDFNNPTSDFIINDFDIYTAPGFDNGSLHSPHPYPSPNNNNTNFNFSTMLKRPIILKENGTMSFDEIVLVEPGEVLSVYGDDDFWDYVIIEGSKDSGETWLPITEGYDSGLNANWKTSYNLNVIDQISNAVGIPGQYINHEINLLENGNFKAGDTILFRFRLFSDPYAHGWGWTIDNLRIQQPVSAPTALLSPGNVMVYPNPFNDKITISIQTKNAVDEITYEVFNQFGQIIKVESVQNIFGEFKCEIDLSAYSSGMYLIYIRENGNPVYSGKVIKN